jgi:GDPmannose 4,6-dehydratase
VNYREAHGIYACNGILFNHESARRGETFVTRKITRGLANVALGLDPCLYLGNLSAMRDWGHAKDYVRAQWLMLQQEAPDDFVIATGIQHSVRDFIRKAADRLGLTLEFTGEGPEELATVLGADPDMTPALKPGDVAVRIDPRYFRPTEVDSLLGDASKARARLGWLPEISLEQMIDEMVKTDLEEARKHALLRKHGYAVNVSVE